MDRVKYYTLETNAIRQHMDEVRRDLDEHAQEIVEGARDMRNWRSYVRSYPWVGVGATVAVGYMIVPRRGARAQMAAMRPDPETLAELAKQSGLASNLPLESSTIAHVLAFVGTLMVREVASYAGQHVRQYFTRQTDESSQDGQR